MTEKPLVSVIINCYNSEKYLRETIDSLIAQTYTNWEAIFWDNCSTDKTAEIIKSVCDKRICYYYAERNTSIGEARNLALKKVSGNYICFLDSDDLWNSCFLEACISNIEKSEAGLIYTRFTYFNEEQSSLAVSYQTDGVVPLKKLIESYNIGMSAAVFRANLITKDKLLFDNSFSLIEDFDFFIRIASLTKVYYLQEPLMWYRCHSNNLSYSDKWVSELSILLEKIESDSNLRQYRKSIRRRKELYQFKQIFKSRGKTKALKYACEHLWSNYKFLKYILLLLRGVESF